MGSNIFPSRGVAGDVGLFPVFNPSGAWDNDLVGQRTTPRGFVDGEFFDIPINSTTSIVYNNETGGTIWTLALTDVNASATNWVSFKLDLVANLFYVVTVNTGTNTVYLTSVNQAGTVVNIGNSVSSGITAAKSWGGTSGSPSLFRASEGSGDFTLKISGNEKVINSSGVVTSTTNITGLLAGSYESTQGIYFNPQTNDDTDTANVNGDNRMLQVGKAHTTRANAIQMIPILAPIQIGLPTGHSLASLETFSILSWGDEIYIVGYFGSTTGFTRYGRAAFDDAVNQLGTNLGLI